MLPAALNACIRLVLTWSRPLLPSGASPRLCPEHCPASTSPMRARAAASLSPTGVTPRCCSLRLRLRLRQHSSSSPPASSATPTGTAMAAASAPELMPASDSNRATTGLGTHHWEWNINLNIMCDAALPAAMLVYLRNWHAGLAKHADYPN